MSDQTNSEASSSDYLPQEEFSQLYQARVPLDDAADAFNFRDASGRIPIVVIPKRLNRIRNDLVVTAVIILVASLILSFVFPNWLWLAVGIPVAVVLGVLGVYSSFIVRIPEGTTALLSKGGSYYKALSSGTHFLPPWILTSHLVTQRQIPFDTPMVETPTSDNVRANIDMLVSFTITDPYRFVYSISADDFDQVFMAACQDALRLQVRRISSEEVVDLNLQSAKEIVSAISSNVETYGVTVNKVNITYAGPPKEFIQSQEQQRLAVLQRKEQTEKQTLAIQRQADEDELSRLRVVAQVVREREALQIQVQAVELERRIAELRAEVEELRLARLEERLKRYPLAAKWETELAQQEIARSLAGNTRAIVHVGHGGEISRAFMISDTLREMEADKDDVAPGREDDKPASRTVKSTPKASPAKE